MTLSIRLIVKIRRRLFLDSSKNDADIKKPAIAGFLIITPTIYRLYLSGRFDSLFKRTVLAGPPNNYENLPWWIPQSQPLIELH